MSARLSLKDQLAELAQPAPVDLDPEDTLAGDGPQKHRLSIDNSAARDHYVQVAPSALRKLHESVNDPKYDGIRTSRKLLYNDSDQELQDADRAEDVQGLSDRESGEETRERAYGDHSVRGSSDDDISQDESGSRSEQNIKTSRFRSMSLRQVAEPPPSHVDDPGPGLPDASQLAGDVAFNLRLTHEADKRKGRAVSRQIALWDTLLDARIQLQKAVVAANRLPSPSESARYPSHPATSDALGGLFDVASSLTEELYTLQEELLRLNESIEVSPRKRRRLDATPNTLDSYGAVALELSASASALEAGYHPWLVDTLSKWSTKVQAVSPNVLLPDTRGSFMRDGRSAQTGVVNLIDDVLKSDGVRLLARTRKRKDKHVRIGSTLTTPREDATRFDREEELDMDVFDDTDYYQQLLRDVIAARGGSDGQGEAQWQMQQRERKAKRKKTVDTKASKGRRLRYEVHAKLQNFMVPVPGVGEV